MLTWKKINSSPEDRGLNSPAFLAGLNQHLGESLRAKGIAKGFNPPPIKVATSSRVEFEAKIGDLTGADLHTAMVELWSKVLDEVEAAYPEGGWDILIVYLTPEIGRVLIYPEATAQLDKGEDKVRVALDVRTWDSAYGEVSELGDDDKKFEVAYKRMLRSFVKSLKDGITDEGVLPRFKTLKKRAGFGVFYVDSAESIRRENLIFLWGNQPPAASPPRRRRSSSRGCSRRASLYPENSMVFEDGVLRVVTFEGAEFNDKYVDLIESVPNAAELCADLRELKLMATRIKPAAVERLRRLLPQVDVQVLVDDD